MRQPSTAPYGRRFTYRDHQSRRLAVLRFPLSYRDVEELLAERSIEVPHESIRRWVAKFGPVYAAELGKREAKPDRT